MEKNSNFRKNKISFGLGTVGRDMVYSMVSMYLMVFITEAVGVTDSVLLSITTIMMVARVFDAFNDPLMGVIVDNTHSKWGKYKPWITIGYSSALLLPSFCSWTSTFPGCRISFISPSCTSFGMWPGQ